MHPSRATEFCGFGLHWLRGRVMLAFDGWGAGRKGTARLRPGVVATKRRSPSMRDVAPPTPLTAVVAQHRLLRASGVARPCSRMQAVARMRSLRASDPARPVVRATGAAQGARRSAAVGSEAPLGEASDAARTIGVVGAGARGGV